MVIKMCASSRPRGRPPVRSDDETTRLLLEAACSEFQARGFGGTTMQAVAARAGVSTRTIYRLVSTKDGLFGLVVADRVDRFMLAIDGRQLQQLPTEEALVQLLVAYATLTLAEETVALTRLVIAESERAPEVAQRFQKQAVERTSHVMSDWLRQQVEVGALTLDDSDLAADMLRGMMIMGPQRAALFGLKATLAAPEIDQRARACARLFLQGSRQRP